MAQPTTAPFRDVFHALPMQDVLHCLAVQDVGRLLLVESSVSKAVAGLRSEVLARRGLSRTWTWRKAHAAEGALFCDLPGEPVVWTRGPNERSACNILERSDDASSWLWMSGGTDWQGFQGGFRCVSEQGVRPSWVTFRVRVATPELSGAFLTLSGEQHLWGMAAPVLVFSYRGDDCTSHKRCFSVQPYSRKGFAPLHIQPSREEVADDKPHDIALHLDWVAGLLTVFVDGERHPEPVPFKAATPIRFAAIYNWRSGARTAFSELMLGNTCPWGELHPAPRRQAAASLLTAACCHRRPAPVGTAESAGRRAAAALRRGLLAGGGSPAIRPWAATGAFLALAAAAALQWVAAAQ